MIGFDNQYDKNKGVLFDATVGTGGDYATVQTALAAGKYKLKLISDVTETIDWGSHTNKIVLKTDGEERTINLSVANTNALTIDATNINFSISGTNNIFTSSTFYLSYCTITGDDNVNTFDLTGYITADTMSVFTGAGTIVMKVNCADIINITYENYVSGYPMKIYGNVNVINTFGVMNPVGDDLSILFYLYSAYIGMINIGHTGIGYIRGNSWTIDGTNGSIYIIGDGTLIHNNCTFALINTPYGFYNNCNIVFKYNQITAFSEYYNCVINDGVIVSANDVIIYNCKFNSLTIDSDNVDVINTECTSGNITINSEVTGTNIIECRTQTEIVDNGTNTNLLMNRLI